MGTAALVGCEAGYVWFAVEVNERLLALATETTNLQHSTGRQMAHVAIPAWEESLKVLVALAHDPRVATHSMPFEAATRDFGQALASIEALPRFNVLSPLNPVLRAASPSGGPTLQAAFYTFWGAGGSVQGHLPQFGRSVCCRLTKLLGKTDDPTAKHSWSELVADVLYQWVAAATTYAGDGERRLLNIDSITNTLGWMRSLFVHDDIVQTGHDLLSILHAYISGWKLCLYAARELAQLPDSVGEELDRFLAALTEDVVSQMPAVLPDGIRLLSQWLE